MGRGIYPIILVSLVFWGCSVTPDEHRDRAFQKYSLDCVARGIPENTEAHTQCVVDQYEKYNLEQRRAEERMRELYAEPEPTEKVASDANSTD